MALLSLIAYVAGFQSSINGPQFRLDSTNSFPFVIPWDDAVSGTATDVSFLNAKPAGKNGRIIAKDGHFFEATTGKRVRFFGTNLGARAAFPLKEDAPKIAAHLAKMGINIVRFHHLQNDWDKEFGMIWKKGREHIEFDPVQVDRLDFFFAELKKQGIYTNMNLQTTRKMVPELGFPASTLEIPNFQKKVDKLNDRMIGLQKQYAKDLIDRVNPYTKLKYRDDPALMVIEINNENSLVGWPGESPGQGLEKWPEPYQSELRAKWNNWLKAKYLNDVGLAKAWPTRDTRSGASATTPKSKWTWENQSNGDVTYTTTASDAEGAPLLTAVIKSNPGPNWNVQAHLGGLTLVNGKTYTVQFQGKADKKVGVNIDSRLDMPDWRFLGLGGSVELTSDWKTYSLSWTAIATEPAHARLGFVLGDIRGTVQIKNLTIREGTLETGVEPGQTLVRGNIGIPSAGTSAKYNDYATFLLETEANYSTAMRKYLRTDLGFDKVNMIDSQISWGGLTSLVREKNMEFADNHAYWNHPAFIGSDWDPKNYRVERNALVNSPDLGTLKDLSIWRVAGKPYSVSEYNHPAPSDFQCEMMPLYAAVGATQDWDILYTFAWDGTGSREKNDLYEGYFDFAKNPAKKAFFPATALTFRLGLFEPFGNFSPIFIPEDGWKNSMFPSAFSKDIDVLTKRHAIATTKFQWLQTESTTTATRTGNGTDNVVVFESDKAISIAGFVGGKSVKTKYGTFKFANTPTNFASLMLTPLDGNALKVSKRVLLTVVGRVENQNMGWNAARDSVSDQWGTAPSSAEVIPVTVTLAASTPVKVSSLDSTGKPKKALSFSNKSFEINLSSRSAWYEITQ
ncbi:MAG: hypothetical protein WCK51_07225 [Armatimonadota bacterium]